MNKKGEIITINPVQVEYRLFSLIIIVVVLIVSKEIMSIFPKDPKGLMLFVISFFGIIAVAHIIISLMKR